MKIREQFVVDSQGRKIGVFLSIDQYLRLKSLASKTEDIIEEDMSVQAEEATEEIRLDKIMEEIDRGV